MQSLHFTAETSSNGVIEHNFTVGNVTSALWSPAPGANRVPWCCWVTAAASTGKHRPWPDERTAS